MAETAQVARAGYREVSTRENAMFNLLSSFVATFVLSRAVTYRLRHGGPMGPFRSLRLGRRHIHHFVPGIVIAFAAGAAAILTRDEQLEPALAVPFGIGMGLTLDESALLLELDDVYWRREGLLSVQISLAVIALLASRGAGAAAAAARRAGRADALTPSACRSWFHSRAWKADLPRPTGPPATARRRRSEGAAVRADAGTGGRPRRRAGDAADRRAGRAGSGCRWRAGAAASARRSSTR